MPGDRHAGATPSRRRPDGVPTAAADIERLDERDTVVDPRASVVLDMAAFDCLFDSFVVDHHVTLRDDFAIDLVGEFLAVGPVCLPCVAMTKRAALHEFAPWLFGVTPTATLSAMPYVGGSADRGNDLFADLLIVVGPVALTRPRMRSAVLAVLVR